MSDEISVRSIFMRFVKIDLTDWWEGCVGPVDETGERGSILSVAEEGLYGRMCKWMYRTGQPLTADVYEGARLLRINHNEYRKLLASLVAKGKIQIRKDVEYRHNGGPSMDGIIFNDRVEREITKYCEAQRATKQPKNSLRKATFTPPVNLGHPPSELASPPQSLTVTPPVI